MVVAADAGLILIILLLVTVVVVAALVARSSPAGGTTASTKEEQEAKWWALAQGTVRDAEAAFARDPSDANRSALDEAKGRLDAGPVDAATPIVDAPAPGSPNPIDQISRLAQLRERGIVSQDEFERTKAALLAKLD